MFQILSIACQNIYLDTSIRAAKLGKKFQFPMKKEIKYRPNFHEVENFHKVECMHGIGMAKVL